MRYSRTLLTLKNNDFFINMIKQWSCINQNCQNLFSFFSDFPELVAKRFCMVLKSNWLGKASTLVGSSTLLALSVLPKTSLTPSALVAKRFCMVLKSLTLIFEKSGCFYGLAWRVDAKHWAVLNSYSSACFWAGMVEAGIGTPVANKFWRVLKSARLILLISWGIDGKDWVAGLIVLNKFCIVLKSSALGTLALVLTSHFCAYGNFKVEKRFCMVLKSSTFGWTAGFCSIVGG